MPFCFHKDHPIIYLFIFLAAIAIAQLRLIALSVCYLPLSPNTEPGTGQYIVGYKAVLTPSAFDVSISLHSGLSSQTGWVTLLEGYWPHHIPRTLDLSVQGAFFRPFISPPPTQKEIHALKQSLSLHR